MVTRHSGKQSPSSPNKQTPPESQRTSQVPLNSPSGYWSHWSSSLPGTFQNGIAEGEVDPTFGPLEAMRLSVLTDSPVWVILSEVRPPGTRFKPVWPTTTFYSLRLLRGPWGGSRFLIWVYGYLQRLKTKSVLSIHERKVSERFLKVLNESLMGFQASCLSGPSDVVKVQEVLEDVQGALKRVLCMFQKFQECLTDFKGVWIMSE